MKSPKASTLNARNTMRTTRTSGTGPELAFRSALRSAGLRGYRVNLSGIPGRPDVAFTRHKLAIFVHGCFWHRCPECGPVYPKRNAGFWREKLESNVVRDERARNRLERLGWTVLELWECEVSRDAIQCAVRVQRWIAEWAEA